jgi:hypothetical protein
VRQRRRCASAPERARDAADGRRWRFRAADVDLADHPARLLVAAAFAAVNVVLSLLSPSVEATPEQLAEAAAA